MGGATLLPMGKSDGDTQPAGWLDYFPRAAAAAGYVGRGWKARLARDLGAYDSHVSRWTSGERIPDIDSCRALARVLGRPILEVLIAAGHIAPEEVGLSQPPAPLPPPRRLSPQLERLALLLDDPDLSPVVRKLIEAQLAATADLVEDATGSAERAIS